MSEENPRKSQKTALNGRSARDNGDNIPLRRSKKRSQSVGVHELSSTDATDALMRSLMNGTLPIGIPNAVVQAKAPIRQKSKNEMGASQTGKMPSSISPESNKNVSMAVKGIAVPVKNTSQTHPHMHTSSSVPNMYPTALMHGSPGRKAKNGPAKQNVTANVGAKNNFTTAITTTSSSEGNGKGFVVNNHNCNNGVAAPLALGAVTTYAGPSFHNSPDARSLPIPIFASNGKAKASIGATQSLRSPLRSPTTSRTLHTMMSESEMCSPEIESASMQEVVSFPPPLLFPDQRSLPSEKRSLKNSYSLPTSPVQYPPPAPFEVPVATLGSDSTTEANTDSAGQLQSISKSLKEMLKIPER